MPEADAIDVILRVQGLRSFVAEMETARASVAKVGGAAGLGAAAGAKPGSSKATDAQRAAALGLIRKAAIGTSLAVGAIGFEATKMGVKFDEALTRVNTQAGEQRSKLGLLEQGVMKLSREVGIGPQSLVEGLYHLESIGIRGKHALEALHTAANLAGVGASNLEVTTSAMGSAFITGIKGASDFTKVAALMNAAVGSGNIKMQELAEALGTGILANAKTAGLSIENVFASLATLTDAGYKASSASAQLATAFHYLYAPSAKAKAALASIHLTGLKLIETLRSKGLVGALKELQEHLNKYSRNPNVTAIKLAEIIPGGRGRTLNSLMNMIQRNANKEKFQQEATEKKYAEAIANFHKTAAFQIKNSWSGVQADLTELGKILEPVAIVAAKALKMLADALLFTVRGIKSLVGWVKDASAPIKAVLLVVGIFLAQATLIGGMVLAWRALTAAAYLTQIAFQAVGLAMKAAFLTNPWVLILMALVTIAILVVTHWTEVKKALEPIFKWMSQAFKDTVNFIVTASENVFSWLKKNWPLVIAILAGPFGIAVYEIVQHWHDLVKFFEGMGSVFKKVGEVIWDALFGSFKWFINNLIIAPLNMLIGAINAMATAYNDIPIHIGTAPHVGYIHALAEGGITTSAGSVLVGERGPELLRLPRGASVEPLDKYGNPERGHTGPMKAHVYVQLEKKTIAEAVGEFTADKMARR